MKLRYVFCVLVCLANALPAHAQPIKITIKGNVSRGNKPALEVEALERVTDITLDLKARGGRRIKARRAALARGERTSFPLGKADGRQQYEGTLSLQTADGRPWSQPLTFETQVSARLKVGYSDDHLDLEARQLEFTLSDTAGSAELVAIGEDGSVIGKGSTQYRGEAAGTWLPIRWTQRPKTRVMKLQLRAVSKNGAATRVELIPWSVTIDHEDVNFATGSAVIESSEFAKLEASRARIEQIVERSGRFMKMKLYIAGHTDTVDTSARNRKLSASRARAIGAYFRRKGLSIPIAVAGYGEQVLKVPTPDNTDEPANRRADYVLGPADGSPPFKGAYRKASVRWKTLR